MSYNRENGNVTEEQIAAFLADAVNRVEGASDNDIELLNTIKKLFKKNVPFARRKYVTAWLVKQATQNYRGNRFNKNDRNDRSNRNERFDRNERSERKNERTERAAKDFNRNEKSSEANTERAERAPRVQIDPALATTIFIGIGRNRRVYPRDLVGLLVSVANLDRERIGDIRVLANYSFIQLFTEDCEKAINALNGYDYRGRKLSVSYSKQKEEGDETVEAVAENAPVVESAPVVETAVASEVNEDPIPANVSNESSGSIAVESEESKIAAAQSAYAAAVEQKPYSETTDDGQVKSHFGDGAAY